MLEIRSLSAGYYRDLLVLRDVDIDAGPGITAILGANGVGKSTLLKAIYGFLRPQAGTVELDGESLVGVAPHEMVNKLVSFIPQQTSVWDHMTVEENLRMGAWPFRRDKARIRRKIDENFERFPDLVNKAKDKAGTLSGGQQRMVEIARSLMADPKVLLVDEPTAGLSKMLSADVYMMLTGLKDEGLTILLVDQEIRDALKVADHVYVLDLGRNKLDGPPSEFVDLEESFWA